MNHTLSRYCALLLLAVGSLWASQAYAYKITCSNPSMSAVSFGNVDPQSTQTDATATFTATCYNDAPATWRAATICLSIGVPAGGGTVASRQMPDGSANTLAFQLYQDPSRSIIWGTQYSGPDTPLMIKVQLGGYKSMQVNATLYGRVLGGQTNAIPGAYTQSYAAGDTRMAVDAPITGSTPPADCQNNPTGSLYFPFTVSADVVNKCEVNASPLDFGTNPGLLTTAVSANAALSVQCSVGTAYNVGLNAGLNGAGNINARKMVLGSNSVGYQLYRNLARTQIWGNTTNADTVAGTGTGNTQSLTVYGSVPPQTTPPAGTYNDTVIVTVTY